VEVAVKGRKVEQQAEVGSTQVVAAGDDPFFVEVFGEEVAGVEVDGGLVGGWEVVAASGSCGGLEGFNINPEGAAGLEGDEIVVGGEVAFGLVYRGGV
jgi:hypothetical protein